MRIAIGLPSRVASASGASMLEWISRAERGPFSSVVVTDRVVSQVLEPLSVLAMAAGATQRIRLMTSIVIGPTRETTLLARQAATIDVLSGGRLTLGLGIGVRENDYLATGFDFHRRGRRVEEQLPTLRAGCGPAGTSQVKLESSGHAPPARLSLASSLLPCVFDLAPHLEQAFRLSSAWRHVTVAPLCDALHDRGYITADQQFGATGAGGAWPDDSNFT